MAGNSGKQEILPPADGAMPYRYRSDGWTPTRQTAFLIALREGGCLREACRHVGLSRTSLARVRRRVPSFADAIELALASRLPALERAAVTRAVTGWEEPVYFGGKLIGHRRRYSDAMLRLLIERADRAAAQVATRSVMALATPEETDAVIMKKLDAIERRRAQAQREETIAFADDMAGRGLAP